MDLYCIDSKVVVICGTYKMSYDFESGNVEMEECDALYFGSDDVAYRRIMEFLDYCIKHFHGFNTNGSGSMSVYFKDRTAELIVSMKPIGVQFKCSGFAIVLRPQIGVKPLFVIECYRTGDTPPFFDVFFVDYVRFSGLISEYYARFQELYLRSVI